MTEQEWLASDDLQVMLCLFGNNYEKFPALSDRKLRLFEDACFAMFGLNLDDAVSQESPVPGIAALLREVVGNPWRPVRIRRSWLTYDVQVLADGAYDMRCWETLPIIADALEEAGCPQEEGTCTACNGAAVRWKGDIALVGKDRYVMPCDVCGGSGKGKHPLLAHLRSPGPHVKGCWALDLVLGEA